MGGGARKYDFLDFLMQIFIRELIDRLNRAADRTGQEITENGRSGSRLDQGWFGRQKADLFRLHATLQLGIERIHQV